MLPGPSCGIGGLTQSGLCAGCDLEEWRKLMNPTTTRAGGRSRNHLVLAMIGLLAGAAACSAAWRQSVPQDTHR
jgi:hypothetical protein